MIDPRRRIPPVDGMLESKAFGDLLDRYPRGRVVAGLRVVVAEVREALAVDHEGPLAEGVEQPETYAALVEDHLVSADVPSLRPVINATGVVIHTNLGRAPLAPEVVDAMQAAAQGYGNLEFDLESGTRGSRYDHCVDLLTELTGAEDALVVNNCAASLLLMLDTAARGRAMAVSRGELVEIGGGFRIPEIMERSGARLAEVGSTNRTRLADYQAALDEGDVAGLLKVHRSNFRISGFTEEVGLEELVALGRERGVPVFHDLGSGLFADPAAVGLPPEPRAAESVTAGVDAVTVSGDKLFGGPQAGMIVGRAEWIERFRKNPMCRALRVDKVTLAGLEATLRLYRDPETAVQRVPTLALLSADADGLQRRAAALAERLREGGVEATPVESCGAIGGGTYPGVEIPSWAVALEEVGSADAVARRMRLGTPALVGRVAEGRVLLDLRTVFPDQDEAVAAATIAAVGRVDG